MAVVDLDAQLATGTADILCRTLDPAFLYASMAVTGGLICKSRAIESRPCIAIA